MKTIKIGFSSWHYNTSRNFLNSIINLTPNRSGKWKNLEVTTDFNEASYIIVFDGDNKPYPKERALLFGQHPKVDRAIYGTNIGNLSPSFRTFENHQCLAKFPLDKFWNAGEMWIDYTYDELMKLTPEHLNKNKKLCCIMTYQTHNPMYNQRIQFMEEFTKKYLSYDLYGRPEEKFRANKWFKSVYKGSLGSNIPNAYEGEHLNGKNMVGDYLYSLEFDVGPTKNYISERMLDSLLLWTCPIYFGSTNVHEILPKNSFHYIDITNLSNVNKVIDIINQPVDYNALKEAREILLNQFQVWPRVHKIVNQIENGNYNFTKM